MFELKYKSKYLYFYVIIFQETADACVGTSISVGTVTEPDCFGPCEPGTHVNLEGIVWNEIEGM